MRRTAPLALFALVCGLVTLAAPAEAATGLDPTYGDDGIATLMVPEEFEGEVELEPAIGFWGAMDPQGRVLLSSFSDHVVRLTPDGDPDPSFGPHGAAEVPSSVGGGPIDASDDSIVVASEDDAHVVVLRLQDDGTPDDVFGDEGLATSTIELPGSEGQPLDVELAPDGSVLVQSQAWVESDQVSVLQRFLPDGSTDEAFGDDGLLTIDVTYPSIADGMDADAAGFVFLDNQGNDWTAPDTVDVVRYHLDGTIDSSFGSDGRTRLDGGALVVKIDDEDGSIVVGGADLAGARTWRLRSDGRIDERFGDGAVRSEHGNVVWDLVLLDQQRVAALIEGGEGDITVAVVDPDGSLAPGFGTGGAVELVDRDFPYSGGIGRGTGGRLLISTRSEDAVHDVRAYATDFADLAPAITEVTPYETSLSVEWVAPEDEGEHPIRIYHLVAMQGGEVAGQSVVAGDLRQASIEGLDPLGESYDVLIQPYDDFGPRLTTELVEVAAAESALAAVAAPAVPGVEVAAGRRSATVWWDALQDDGGSTIWGYAVVAVQKSGGALAAWRNVRADVRTTTLPELTNGAAHDVYVFAVTSEGFGAVGTPVAVTPTGVAPAAQAPQVSWASVVPVGPSAIVTWGPTLERGEPTWAVHVIVIEDGAMTQWKAMTEHDRQVVVPAAEGAQVYVVAQSASGFGPLSGPLTVG